jgi:glyoxylase-like metal-dependent hydrolase (beta-lactamase superfamily II)
MNMNDVRTKVATISTRRSFLGGAVLAGMAVGTEGVLMPSATNAAPAADTKQPRGRLPAVYPFALGDFRITTLFDGSIPQDLPVLLVDTPQSDIDRALQYAFQTNPTEASINAFLIETGSRRVMIDAGGGTFLGPNYGGKAIESLALAGFKPEEIDDILITHLHADHYGSLIDGERRVFPNATIHLSETEFSFFMNSANARKRAYDDSRWFQTAQKVLGPYQRAGKIKTFSQAGEVVPGIAAVPAPGHTPGHTFYRVQSKDRTIDICGDIVHVAAFQFAKPATTLIYDADAAGAAATRARHFAFVTGERRLIAGAHIAFPGIGHVRKDGDGYAWVPIDYCYRGEI